VIIVRFPNGNPITKLIRDHMSGVFKSRIAT
jgi:hypothetical protein